MRATAPQWAEEEPARLAVLVAIDEDGFAASQSLTVAWPLVSAPATEGTFTSISYEKGSAVIAGLARRVDAVLPGSFIAGLRALLSLHAYSSARPPDVITALSAAASIPSLGTEFSTPLYLPGVPLLRVEHAVGGGSLVISAVRFFVSSNSAAKAAAAGQALAPWTVLPLAITAASPSAALLNAAAEAAAAVGSVLGGTQLPASIPYTPSDGWVLVTNSSAADYVRVLYQPDNYARLSSALRKFPVINIGARATLLDDLFSAAAARTPWESTSSAPTVNMSFALAWAASWIGTEEINSVRAVFEFHLRRLQQLIVDDVPFESCGNPSVVPEASIPGTRAYDCSVALRQYASSFGVTLETFATDRVAMSLTISGPLCIENASNLLFRTASNPFGRDLAWAAFRERSTTFVDWYGSTSTLSGLAQSLAVNLHSTDYAVDEEEVWTGLGVAASVAQGFWQRGVERIVASASWYTADVENTCSFLVSGWGGTSAGPETRNLPVTVTPPNSDLHAQLTSFSRLEPMSRSLTVHV